MKWLNYAAMALAIVLFATTAHAKWKPEYGDSAYAAWFAAQHNKNGEWCCDKSDGHWFDNNYQLNNDGSVTLELESGTHTIEPYKVLTTANPTGRAVWWHSDSGMDYCFAPGTLG